MSKETDFKLGNVVVYNNEIIFKEPIILEITGLSDTYYNVVIRQNGNDPNSRSFYHVGEETRILKSSVNKYGTLQLKSDDGHEGGGTNEKHLAENLIAERQLGEKDDPHTPSSKIIYSILHFVLFVYLNGPIHCAPSSIYDPVRILPRGQNVPI
jgi:hypothetical protein